MDEKKTVVPGIFKVGEGVLINKDNDSLTAYRTRKMKNMKIDEIQSEMEKLKNDISEIKELLRELLNK